LAKSYYAIITSTSKKILAKTIRYQSYIDAILCLEKLIKLHGGKKNCSGDIIPSDEYPEMFSHCDSELSQVIGSKCARCKKILTIEDAKLSIFVKKFITKENT